MSRTSQRMKFKKASAACRRKRVKPFTHAFGRCMRAQLGTKSRRGKKRGRRGCR